MSWEPTEQEIEEKLIALAYLWGDIEESTEDIPFTPAHEARTKLAEPIRKAFRVEVVFDYNGCTWRESANRSRPLDLACRAPTRRATAPCSRRQTRAKQHSRALNSRPGRRDWEATS